MKKKIFSILLSLCMVLTMIPVATGVAWAEGETPIENVTFGYAYDVQRSNAYPKEGENVTLSGLAKPIVTSGDRDIRGNSNGAWTLTKAGTYAYMEKSNKATDNLEELVQNLSRNYTALNTALNLDTNKIIIHELKNKGEHIAYGVVVAYGTDNSGKYALFQGDTLSGSGAGYFLTESARYGKFNVQATELFTENLQSRSINLEIAGGSSFEAKNEGYGEGDVKTVTVTNTGAEETGDLVVNLSGADAKYFEILPTLPTESTISSITTVGGTATFSIKPKNDLAAKTYKAKITVGGKDNNGNNGIEAQSLDISFTVNANVLQRSINLNVENTYTFPEATVGYKTHAAKKVTITNTGNVATGNLNVALSGGEVSNFTVEPNTIRSIEKTNNIATFFVAPKNDLSVGEYTETVTVSGDNIASQSFNVRFTVKAAVTKTLSSIAVTTPPTKTNYTAGERFDPTGMVVTATYSDNSKNAITDYTIIPDAALTTDNTRITISYTEGEVTKRVVQAITVNALKYSITVTGGKATQDEGTEINEASVGTTVTLTANAAYSGKEFDKWVVENGNITLADANSATTTFTMPAGEVSVKATYKDVPHTGGGSHSSSIQKPTIIAGEGAETSLSILGTNLTIKVTEGYELTDVILNGVSKGKVTELTGLRTGDKVEVKTEKKQEKPSKEEIIAALDSSKLVARSKLITLENGKKAVRVTWYDQNGNEIDFDGIEVYRSVKRYKGYGLEPFYTTKGDKSEGYYVNTKDLKEGTTYYYKVRGYVTIDGQKYYTDYSDKAWRTIK